MTSPSPSRSRRATSTRTSIPTWRSPASSRATSRYCSAAPAAASAPRPTSPPVTPPRGRGGRVQRRQRPRPRGRQSGGPTTSRCCWAAPAAASAPPPTSPPARGPLRSWWPTSTATKPDLAVVDQVRGHCLGAARRRRRHLRPSGQLPLGADPTSVVAADFNGDQDPDLAVRLFCRQGLEAAQRRRRHLRRSRRRSAPSWAAVPSRRRSVTLTATKTPDLVIATSWWARLGAGGRRQRELQRAEQLQDRLQHFAGPSSIAVRDFDGDGKPDLAVANVNDDNISVLLNNTNTNQAPVAVNDTYGTAEDTPITVPALGASPTTPTPTATVPPQSSPGRPLPTDPSVRPGTARSATPRLPTTPAPIPSPTRRATAPPNPTRRPSRSPSPPSTTPPPRRLIPTHTRGHGADHRGARRARQRQRPRQQHAPPPPSSPARANGTLTLNPDGAFAYTPAANFNGPDSFTYRASDGSAQSSPATVTITVSPVSDAPAAAADSTATAEDTARTVAAPGCWATTATPTATP